MKEKLIAQGAEAVLIKKKASTAQLLADNRDALSARHIQGSLRSLTRSAPQFIVLKRRVRKGYRIAEMDEKIRKLRTRSEAKLLEKAGKIISVPKVLKVDEKSKEIDMEFISGEKLSDKLNGMKNWKDVCYEIGKNIALLHDAGIIHGDLTTSNMIWKLDSQLSEVTEIDNVRSAHKNINPNPARPKSVSVAGAHPARDHAQKPYLKYSSPNRSPALKHIDKKLSNRKVSTSQEYGRLYFIDFGLGFANGRVEDKAVDIYLIKEALEAKHFLHFEKFFKVVLEGYKKTSKHAAEVLKRLEKVEKRGRYKQNY